MRVSRNDNGHAENFRRAGILTIMRLTPQQMSHQSTTCLNCGRKSFLISRALELCQDCIRNNFEAVLPIIDTAHSEARKPFGLAVQPPKATAGLPCRICTNECRIPPQGNGYCGLRSNNGNRLAGASASRGNVTWYYDPLPTNCVADWVCAGGTGAGFPRFAYSNGAEHGYKNLAVFYQACSFDCLFCQNWHYRYSATGESKVTASELAQAVDERTACICYFGGDPTPQLPHAIRTSEMARQRNEGRILRICWETNGSMRPDLLRRAAALSLESGGCMKFDLKAWSEQLHIALCGVSNKRTLQNFEILAEYAGQRNSPPFLVASTLLIPGYIDTEEISKIAAFISSLSPDIPYALLAFHPQFKMNDLPCTSEQHAYQCLAEAKAQGLRNVRLGNIHLLGHDY